jgi:hypothetical protein
MSDQFAGFSVDPADVMRASGLTAEQAREELSAVGMKALGGNASDHILAFDLTRKYNEDLGKLVMRSLENARMVGSEIAMAALMQGMSAASLSAGITLLDMFFTSTTGEGDTAETVGRLSINSRRVMIANLLGSVLDAYLVKDTLDSESERDGGEAS